MINGAPQAAGVPDGDTRLRQLALSYAAPFKRYFVRRGVPQDAAEDCAQDVFLRIARADDGTIGRPWDTTKQNRVANDPILHTEQIQAAVRIEQYKEYPLPDWATYAMLRRQNKPADYIVFPQALHQLRNPQQRFDSLEGNVDWYDFWLNGHEEPEPAKREQYTRREGLCDHASNGAHCVRSAH